MMAAMKCETKQRIIRTDSPQGEQLHINLASVSMIRLDPYDPAWSSQRDAWILAGGQWQGIQRDVDEIERIVSAWIDFCGEHQQKDRKDG